MKYIRSHVHLIGYHYDYAVQTVSLFKDYEYFSASFNLFTESGVAC